MQMMYTGPIMRTYETYAHYQYDSAQMARYGYQVMNVQSDKVTNGCWLTTILIFGLLLTPVCIGLLILLLLPTAFSTRLTVYYIPAAAPPAYIYAAPAFTSFSFLLFFSPPTIRINPQPTKYHCRHAQPRLHG